MKEKRLDKRGRIMCLEGKKENNMDKSGVKAKTD